MRRTVSRRTQVGLSVVLSALVLAAPQVSAQGAKKAEAKKLEWGPAPAVFHAGAKLAVVSGNPMSAGNYVVQLSMPSGYKIAPHFHPTDEHIKVVKGTFRVGMGDKIDEPKTKKMSVGDTITAPAKAHHYALAEGATIVEVSGMGPFQLTYVNPADMPKAAKEVAKKAK